MVGGSELPGVSPMPGDIGPAGSRAQRVSGGNNGAQRRVAATAVSRTESVARLQAGGPLRECDEAAHNAAGRSRQQPPPRSSSALLQGVGGLRKTPFGYPRCVWTSLWISALNTPRGQQARRWQECACGLGSTGSLCESRSRRRPGSSKRRLPGGLAWTRNAGYPCLLR